MFKSHQCTKFLGKKVFLKIPPQLAGLNQFNLDSRLMKTLTWRNFNNSSIPETWISLTTWSASLPESSRLTSSPAASTTTTTPATATAWPCPTASKGPTTIRPIWFSDFSRRASNWGPWASLSVHQPRCHLRVPTYNLRFCWCEAGVSHVCKQIST